MALWHRVRSVITRTRAAVDASARASSEAFAEQLLCTPRYADPRKLNHFELQMYSQNGEDGILAEVFRRVGVADRYFVEFGVENGLETNTTYLLYAGWRGVWVDGNAEALAAARGSFRPFLDAGALRVEQAFVTAENAADLLRDAGVPAEFDLLSVDIDRNTYHLWRALDAFRPRVVVAEYNASVPACDDWVIPYDAGRLWNGTVQYGASLKAFERLGRERGYALVGCNLAGVNAFFVRDDLLGDRFAGPFTAEAQFEPPRYWLRWRAGHLRGVER
jgi:hypothetical protein